MRLTADQARLIREAVHKRFGPEARVWLFGSRVNDEARGGDIDLLVEVEQTIAQPFSASIGLETDLQYSLGDQKIDILLHHGTAPPGPIQRIAKTTGIEL